MLHLRYLDAMNEPSTSSAAHSEGAIDDQAARFDRAARLRARYRFRIVLALVGGPVAVGLLLVILWSSTDPPEVEAPPAVEICEPFVHDTLTAGDFTFNAWNADGTEVWADIRYGSSVIGVRGKANERADRASTWRDARSTQGRAGEAQPVAFCVDGDRVRVAGRPSFLLQTFEEPCGATVATTWNLCPRGGPCFLSPRLPPVSSPCSMATDLALLGKMTEDEKRAYLGASITPERLVREVCRRCARGRPTVEALYDVEGTLWAVVRQTPSVSPDEPALPTMPFSVMPSVLPGRQPSKPAPSASVLLLAGQRLPVDVATPVESAPPR